MIFFHALCVFVLLHRDVEELLHWLLVLVCASRNCQRPKNQFYIFLVLVKRCFPDNFAPRGILIDFGKSSEEHTSELQSLMRISYAVFCLKKKKTKTHIIYTIIITH